MIEIINKPLLLHLVGYLYYWQMGFNSVFKGLMFRRYYFYRHLSTTDFPAGYMEDKIPPIPTPLAEPPSS